MWMFFFYFALFVLAFCFKKFNIKLKFQHFSFSSNSRKITWQKWEYFPHFLFQYPTLSNLLWNSDERWLTKQKSLHWQWNQTTVKKYLIKLQTRTLTLYKKFLLLVKTKEKQNTLKKQNQTLFSHSFVRTFIINTSI